jgi:hypothetical protein
MTTLELTNESPPFKFKSLGIRDRDTEEYKSSNDFPKETTYELTDGKFPLTDYKDLFEESNTYHTLNNDIKIKITGFNNSCEEGKINNDKLGNCKITVEKATEEATGPATEKATEEATTGGRKSKRRKSKRRKSKRRKSNRRR